MEPSELVNEMYREVVRLAEAGYKTSSIYLPAELYDIWQYVDSGWVTMFRTLKIEIKTHEGLTRPEYIFK